MELLVISLGVVGIALLIAERRMSADRFLATGGIVLVAIAALIAVGGAVAAVAVLFAASIAALAACGLLVGRLALRAQRRRARCGAEALVGHVGVVRRALDPVGQVAVDGELWRARRSWAEEDDPPPAHGEAVVVDHVDGLVLTVRRAELWEVER